MYHTLNIYRFFLFNVSLTFSKFVLYYNHKEEIKIIIKERKIKRDAIMIY